ncbi:MAG: hypothetical protein CBB68_14250 [Rhodospirillaceae bacterium TMED8]|nr:hypothetical protein [Magnetovibrio sp.]OUT48119.1 MAG: hypothetical protein CBB68_14250 [Rhodospirillaceae bacterium TMED8]
MIGEVSLTPLFPLPVIAVFGALSLLLVLPAMMSSVSVGVWRLAATLGLLVAVLNPELVRENRKAQSDIVIALVDRTASQSVGRRNAQAISALAHVKASIDKMPNMELQVSEVQDSIPEQTGSGTTQGTLIMRRIQHAIGSVSKSRLAGILIISDGQIHDATPEAVDLISNSLGEYTPIHALITGERSERDRQIIVEKAPAYGLVGKKVSIEYRVEDRIGQGLTDGPTANAVGLAKVSLSDGDEVLSVAHQPVGQTRQFEINLDHAGPSVLTLEVEPMAGELSTLNNKALVSINGVRDRLRVLLVSGQPHAGERTWRNMLKADPAVDLIHFTILRPPEKDDFTPLNEISLIAFPTRELFEVKLKEFDLVLFDRYVVRDVLPPSYLENINNYVKNGGALFLAVGPEYARQDSLYQTTLGQLLPAEPSGRIIEKGFLPKISNVGMRHPITANLPGGGAMKDGGKTKPKWGRWFRQLDTVARDGDILMTGLSRPLLVVDRFGKGRTATLLSDHIWLWARGFEGGGPYAELLRRTAHWLMKEPDLEEENLRAEVRGGKLLIKRRSLIGESAKITVVHPSGEETNHVLDLDQYGQGHMEIHALGVGLYRVKDGELEIEVAASEVNPIEFTDLRATSQHLRSLVKKTGGSVRWINQELPDIRKVRSSRTKYGKSWLGLLENRAYVVTGMEETQLAPPMLLVLIILTFLMTAWWREGH